MVLADRGPGRSQWIRCPGQSHHQRLLHKWLGQRDLDCDKSSSASAIAGVYNPPYGGATGFTSYSQPFADSQRVWFAGNYSSYGNNATAVALYVPGHGFYWMSSIGGQLAGGCF